MAGILVSGASALIRGEKLPAKRGLYVFGAGVIGIMPALPLPHASPGILGSFLLPGLAVTAVILILGFAGGLSLARFQPEISRGSGVLSMLPGPPLS